MSKEHENSTFKKRKQYIRKCAICGERYDQHDMVRDYNTTNEWICLDCMITLHPEDDEELF